MIRILWLVFFFSPVLLAAQAEDFPYEVSSNTLNKLKEYSGKNSAEAMQMPYVVLVSIDGYRYDYTQRYGAKNLNSFGVKAKWMIPSFPSKTFPNHYAIITGMYPGNHGLVSNTFYSREKKQKYSISDREKVRDEFWYYGTPLWVGANERQMVSASMFWVGSEAPVKGILPNYYFDYDRSISNEERVNMTVNWLYLEEEIRPHFITLYFELIDDLGHDYGPDSDEIASGVGKIDRIIGDLKNKLDQTGLPVNIIIVSDHGMMDIIKDDPIDLSPYQNDAAVITSSFPVMIYSEDQEYLDSAYVKLRRDDRVSVYRRDSLPEHYHYHLPDRIGDLVITPKPGYFPNWGGKIRSAATHGFDINETTTMGAIFYADGPDFKEDLIIEPFENIHVYSLIAELLGIPYEYSAIDGNKEALQKILKK